MTDFELVLFFILIALVIYAISAHSPEKEVQEDQSIVMIKNDCKTIRSDLDKIKERISNDEHIKEESQAYYKWILKSQCDWFNYATPDDLWNEYQKHKTTELLKIANLM